MPCPSGARLSQCIATCTARLQKAEVCVHISVFRGEVIVSHQLWCLEYLRLDGV